MWSSRHAIGAWVFFAALVSAVPARAQQIAEGFGVERLYLSAPEGGWFVMDSLDLQGGWGVAGQLTMGYSHDSLRVTDGRTRVAVVSDQAVADFGFAATYDRWRVYLDLQAPLAGEGESGTVGGVTFQSPRIDLGFAPDVLGDARVGIDGRLWGEPGGPFRLGASVQLYVPSGSRADYVSDGTYRGMGRVLFAGDMGSLTYAGQIGVHIRPRDDASTAGSPRGSELLFGLAAGAKMRLDPGGAKVFVIGPEIFGATAFASFFGPEHTAFEGMLTGRFEGTGTAGPQLRVKLGAGAGLDPRFGAPEYRLVVALEIFDHGNHREKAPATP
jgi:hypothetical protein